MSYTNYKKLSYILSEESGLSGKIAFEFLDKIITSNNILQFTFYGHGIRSKKIDNLIEMYDNTVVLLNKGNEEKFLIKNFDIKDGLCEILCSLGEFPNFLRITRINDISKSKLVDYCWYIEYSDEVFTFVYIDKFVDDLKIISIEQELLNKGIHYERKEYK